MTFTPTDEQAAVIHAPINDDVLVVAGAGSGKTFTMTQRIISLIEQGVPAERILGLTFTRKAAAELLSRVSAAVMVHEDDGEPNPDKAFLKPEIYTYDAFFQSIVRQYGLLVGVSQDVQPLSEAGAFQLASDVVEQHMELLFDLNDGTSQIETTDTAGMGDGGEDMGEFRKLTSKMLELVADISSSMIGGECLTFQDAVHRVRQWDEALIKRLSGLIGDEEVPVKDPTPPKAKLKRAKKDTDESYAAKLAEYDRICHNKCLYHADQLLRATRRRETLLTLAEEFQHAKQRAGMAQFSDFTVAAYQLIRRFPSIGDEYRRRYSHVFLDEYQDTSTTQATLLAALFHASKGGQQHEEHSQSRDTAVTAVGDPFQSIYAWRGASPGAFRMFQHDFDMDADHKPYSLSQTRRNAQMVLDAANALTAALRTPSRIPSSSQMREVAVKPLTAMDDAPTGTLGVLGYATLGQEADAVARFAKQAVARYGVDPSTGERSAKPCAAVLMRSKTNVQVYRDALERAGLTCAVVGYSELLDRPEVQDLLAVLRVVGDHTDAASLMRLLATPRFGMASEDLWAFANLVDEINTEYRYRALVEAGLVPDHASRGDQTKLVQAHRDEVPNGVFMTDVLLCSDLPQLLGRSTVSARGRYLIGECSGALQQIEIASRRSLTDVMRCAVEALGLDTDCMVAQAIAGNDTAAPIDAKSSLTAVTDLVNAYIQELTQGQAPTLRGFMTWVDALKTVEEPPSGSEQHADVTLMTIHQSKGLEWDAVAVVGLKKGGFPSNQGSGLSIGIPQDAPTGHGAGQWKAPEYYESARTWLTDITKVPVPIRVDAGILPRFPHDAVVGADPIEELQALDSVERVFDEAFAARSDDGEGGSRWNRPDAPERAYLSQSEEYGRRLHADERRLAYVAVTRAKHDAMLTFAAGNEECRVQPDGKAFDPEKNASVFWLEMHDAMASYAPVCDKPTNIEEPVEISESDVSSVAGFFVGESAQEYENAVVGGAWLEPERQQNDEETVVWPRRLQEMPRTVLERSAEQVRLQQSRLKHVSDSNDSTDSDERLTTISETDGVDAPEGSLLAHARQLMALSMVDGASESEFAALKAAGERIVLADRQNVTAIQTRASLSSEQEERKYWTGIVRPIPRVAAPEAQEGTVFHDWAAKFICPEQSTEESLWESRESMLHDLQERERQAREGASQRERRLLIWQRRLADSSWAERNAVWAERSIVISLNGMIINGKLDAVFQGGLDPNDSSKRFTIVDWKTGRQPTNTRDIQDKLAQLDMYRLLLSRLEDIPLDGIDATLYYVSNADEHQRELHALMKSEDDIIRTIMLGLPKQSDND